jgi:hypothetical protein
MKRVIVLARRATQYCGIVSLESIPGLHKRLKIRAQYRTQFKNKRNGRLRELCKCEDDFLICDFKKRSEFPIASNLFNFSNTAYSEGALEYLQYDEEDLNDCVQNVFGAFLD